MKKTNSNTIDRSLLTSVIVHAHPIIELQVKNLHKDEFGYIADCLIYNSEFKELESSFFLTEDVAQQIIDAMQKFLDNCK